MSLSELLQGMDGVSTAVTHDIIENHMTIIHSVCERVSERASERERE